MLRKEGRENRVNSSGCFRRYEGKLAAYPIVKFILKHSHSCKGNLVDLGCGSGPYKDYFSKIDNYIGIDIESNNSTIRGDIISLPIKSGSVDTVLCNQVLEHIPNPDKAIQEIGRILKVKGALILSVPQMGRLHGEPNDYFRFTKWGVKHLLENNGLSVIALESHGGFFRAFGSHLNFFFIEYLGRRLYLKNALRITLINFNNLLFPLLDRMFFWDKDTLGYSVLAEKK